VSGPNTKPPRTVIYIEFGYSSARDFWIDVALRAYDRFKAVPEPHTAIDASVHAWHVHEWVWHEQNPGVDIQREPGRTQFRTFQEQLIRDCPELTLVRDIADASKHRGLCRAGVTVHGVSRAGPRALLLNGRPRQVRTDDGRVGVLVVNPGMQLALEDGSRCSAPEAIDTVVAFWNERFGVTGQGT
jgi:hypothetical protein